MSIYEDAIVTQTIPRRIASMTPQISRSWPGNPRARPSDTEDESQMDTDYLERDQAHEMIRPFYTIGRDWSNLPSLFSPRSNVVLNAPRACDTRP